MLVYPLQGASSPSFASGSNESEPQRDHFSILCPPSAHSYACMSLRKVSTVAHHARAAVPVLSRANARSEKLLVCRSLPGCKRLNQTSDGI